MTEELGLVDLEDSYVLRKKFDIESEDVESFVNLMDKIKKYNHQVDFDNITKLFTTDHLNSIDILNKTLNMYSVDLMKDMEICYDWEDGKDNNFDCEKNVTYWAKLRSHNKRAPLSLRIIPQHQAKKCDYKIFISLTDENIKPDMRKHDILLENKTNANIQPISLNNCKTQHFKCQRIYFRCIATEICSFKVLAEFKQIDDNKLKQFELKKKVDIFEKYKQDHNYDPNASNADEEKEEQDVRGKVHQYKKMYDKVLNKKKIMNQKNSNFDKKTNELFCKKFQRNFYDF